MSDRTLPISRRRRKINHLENARLRRSVASDGSPPGSGANVSQYDRRKAIIPSETTASKSVAIDYRRADAID
ncbi:hypothetical protein [Novipirellula aureliae]|uniref:hypothetical protein n=1 Tax=Novipirellula aureliae TaxID=2527966 RepID=UPI0011B5BE50|nr:hypothetical protein [Novipirellula aureliae]